MMASMVNIVLHVVGYLLVIAGTLLDISIGLTMHIKDLINSIPAIYQVWTTIRDISGLFFIFFLLYAAFKIILGFDGKYGDLIKNIVIAGILINFSFFITSMLIDMSNMVSLAIYNAMLPNDEVTIDKTTTIGSLVNLQKGHALSNAFMQGLSIPSLFDSNSQTGAASDPSTASTAGALMKIVLVGVIGILTIVIASISFFIASVAFIVRLFVLIFLLAFSPLWFASWVIPDLKKQSKKFTDMLYSQLVFMPVYLLLMYAALSIITKSSIFGGSLPASTAAGNALPMGDYVALLINAVFIIFMLNLPLYAGLSIGGLVTGSKWGADSISKWAGKKAGSWAGRNTIGRAASIANNSDAMKKISTRVPSLGIALSKQLGKAENAGFGEKKGGFKDVSEAKKKEYKDLHEKYVSKATSAEKVDDEKATVGGKVYDNSTYTTFDEATKTRVAANKGDAGATTEFERMKEEAEAAQRKRSNDYIAAVEGKGASTIMGRLMSSTASVLEKGGMGAVGNAVLKPVMKSMNTGGVAAVEELKKKQKEADTKKLGEQAQKIVDDLNAKNRILRDQREAVKKSVTDDIDQLKIARDAQLAIQKQSLQDVALGITQYEQAQAARQQQMDALSAEIAAAAGSNALQRAMGETTTTDAQEKRLAALTKAAQEAQASVNALKQTREDINEAIKKVNEDFDEGVEALNQTRKASVDSAEKAIKANQDKIAEQQAYIKKARELNKKESSDKLDNDIKDLKSKIEAGK